MDLQLSEWPSEILLVEDNPADVFLVQRSILKGDWNINLHVVENGKDALKFLRKEGDYSQSPTPELILLDLNLPVMDGRQFLETLVDDEKLHHMPVIVLTTSENEADVLNMYRLRCSAYFVKPVDLPNFHTLMGDIWAYWRAAQFIPSGGDHSEDEASKNERESRLPPRPRRVWVGLGG